jgi:hypothetical protein
MREECGNWGKDFSLPLEKYREVGKDEKMSLLEQL